MDTRSGGGPDRRGDAPAAMAVKRRTALVGLGLVLTLGLALRLLGLAWGLPGETDAVRMPIHPDEHEAFVGAEVLYSGPKAATFIKGGAFYIRLGWLTRRAVETWLAPGTEFGKLAATVLVLRLINLPLALATALLVAWIGNRVGGCIVGLGAAAFFVCFPNHLLDSHYARPDVLVVFLVTAALACACHVARAGGARFLLLGGGCAGLATGTILSGLVAFAPLATAAVEFERRQSRGALAPRLLREGGLLALGAAIGYLAANVEALLFWDAFLHGLRAASIVHQGGAYTLPTRLLLGVAPYAFGAVTALAAYAGLVLLLRRRTAESIVVASHLLFGYVLLGRVGGHMMRYLEIVGPATAVAAAIALVAVARQFTRLGPSGNQAAAGVFGTVALLTAQLSFSYVWPMQFTEDPRYRAGRWLLDNAPAGSTIGMTASFYGDLTYQPRFPVNRLPFSVYPLMLRPNFDASGYLELDLDYIATSDYARSYARGATAPGFFRGLFREDRYRLAATAGPPWEPPFCLPHWLGVRRPGDLLYVRTTLYIFERR